ncbi:MAG: IS110 family transposase [Actinobacteria bacterium]|nr:IS110 family transposase [Actinomycetota bacterium]
MVLIGIDSHKATHTAVVVDDDERELARIKVRSDRSQVAVLLEFAEAYRPRRWAIESAGGLGFLLAQQLVRAGEDVVDVPATLAARVRLLGSGRGSKNDPNDALSTAIAALRDPHLRTVVVEDHAMVLRLLADRHQDLTSLRTQAVCRLHALIAALVPGGVGRRISADGALSQLQAVRPSTVVETARRDLALDLVADIRRLDAGIAAVKASTAVAVAASATTVTDVFGVGPVVAALLIGHTGDITRFPTPGHYASYNGTAPIEASSGKVVRHRLNQRGNRQLNHALHMAAVTQIRFDTPGRAYYLRKIEEGKSAKEARRALKRRISDAVYRQMRADALG